MQRTATAGFYAGFVGQGIEYTQIISNADYQLSMIITSAKGVNSINNPLSYLLFIKDFSLTQTIDGAKAGLQDAWNGTYDSAIGRKIGAGTFNYLLMTIGGAQLKGKGTACKAVESGSKATGTYGDLVSSGQKDAHHIIQDAAVRDISGYNRMDAPAIQLDGPSNVVGTEHYYATITQRKNGGGIYGAERGIAYMSLRKAGLSVDDAKAAVRGADDYFMGQLGLTLDSPTRIPGNRRQ